MKVFRIVFIAIVSIIVLVLGGLFIFIKTFDVNKYLPQITDQVGKAINRQVAIKSAQLDLSFKGVALSLKNLTISEDPYFSKGNFLSVDDIYVGLDVMALITQKKVQVTDVIVNAPHISIIRLVDGQINLNSLAPAAKTKTTVSNQQVVVSNNSSASSAALPIIFVRSISVEHVQISFEDKNPQMPLHVSIPDLEVKINDFSLSDPFTFSLNANAWGKQGSNIIVDGHCSLDISKNAARIADLQIKTDLSNLDWNKVITVTPMLAKLPVTVQDIKGKVVIDLPQFVASAKGLEGLVVQASLTDGYIKLKELLNPVEKITLKVEGDLKTVTVKQAQAYVGSGELDVSADVKELLTSPTYTFRLETKSLKVEDLVDESKFPAVFKGALNAQFAGSGAGFAPETAMNSIKGSGNLNFTDAKIEKLNILNMITNKLSFIPGIGGLIQSALTSSISDKLNQDTTVLTKLQSDLKVEDKVITLSNAQMDSNLFSITAQGTVGFDMTTSIDVKSYLATDLSAQLVKKVPPLSGLQDDQSRIYIPGKVSGKAPAISYNVDKEYLTSHVINSQVSDQLQKVLDKNPQVGAVLNSIFGGNKNSSTSSTDSSSSAQDQSSDSQKADAKKIINNVMSIFK